MAVVGVAFTVTVTVAVLISPSLSVIVYVYWSVPVTPGLGAYVVVPAAAPIVTVPLSPSVRVTFRARYPDEWTSAARTPTPATAPTATPVAVARYFASGWSSRTCSAACTSCTMDAATAIALTAPRAGALLSGTPERATPLTRSVPASVHAVAGLVDAGCDCPKPCTKLVARTPVATTPAMRRADIPPNGGRMSSATADAEPAMNPVAKLPAMISP